MSFFDSMTFVAAWLRHGVPESRAEVDGAAIRGRPARRDPLARGTATGSLAEQAPGDDTLPDAVAQPHVEVAADTEVVGDVVAGQPQRDQPLPAARPERPVVVAADQGGEELAA